MTRILVTGAGGFVGTHLIKELQTETGAEIFAAVYQSTSDVTSLIPADHVISGNLTDAKFANDLVQTTAPEIIYHLAALSVVQNSATEATAVLNSNSTLQYNLLEAVKLHAPRARLIAVCSGNAYGAVDPQNLPIKESTPFRPLNPYAVSKITQEMLSLSYCLAYGLDVVILRPFNHTGEGQTPNFVIPMLAKQFVQIERGAPPVIEVGNLDTARDFTDVLDMVKAYALAGQKCLTGEAYNIGSGTAHSVQDLLNLLERLTGKKVTIKQTPAKLRPGDVPILVADSTKFRQATGWVPKIPLEQTLGRILDYWRKQT